MSELTHINANNLPEMVDISDKKITLRKATAQAIIDVTPAVSCLLENGEIHSKKGPVFQTAIIAATMAAKKTHDLIPFCHPLPLEKCKVVIQPLNPDQGIECSEIQILVTCQTTGKTGIEMEALTAANIAALTIYDMCKAVSQMMEIKSCKLIEKTGGKSDFSIPVN
ncbi:cyclic pyranopterin monophosphate synthase MoaC [Akkermansiaceae bacterium]|nr:cyclic pyranopterin monophosphate synthase MoaC [Akkermansiaceae bacterium]